jgi:endonuclease YncB( thermonuclease family)
MGGMSASSKLVLTGALLVAAAVYVRPDATADVAPAPSEPSGALLVAAPHGDGDSWKDTAGQEYRLGMVNAPEVDECFGAEATAERQRLTAAGFRADVYATDRYGRGVAVVTLPDGRNLNVHLAREGFADDRYLDDFREQHPELAAELEPAFASARDGRRGLWGACP